MSSSSSSSSSSKFNAGDIASSASPIATPEMAWHEISYMPRNNLMLSWPTETCLQMTLTSRPCCPADSSQTAGNDWAEHTHHTTPRFLQYGWLHHITQQSCKRLRS
jgi:hypothetical protein